MTREDAEKRVQELLARMQQIFDQEVRPITDEHRIEFSFMGSTMHYRDYYDYHTVTPKKALAKTGFFVTDAEWDGSGMGCGADPSFYNWRRANWPEDFDGEDD